MKAYSQDFRQKIIDVYQREKLSQRQLAKRFDVATSFIIKLLKQYRETGNLAPRAHGGGKPAQLTPVHLETITDWIAANNDLTLAQLCDQFEQRYQVRVSRSTMGRAVQQLKLTVKKNLSGD